ncbi:phospholipase effector Tle1 domain-containing protein [Collimonas antrihumi]|uniref:phospholipase effector Tle1 domain-containing protein n=1 Tax=Collimonas antrihumi TaxID=1940615 RepID=UPI001FE36FAA|nr:DUF2235 domain-containing protein [Collimonas antrihumi]
MNIPIQSAPSHISDNAENEMLLSTAECRHVQGIDDQPAKNAPPCQKFVKIGLFFDGTNNNMIRDEPLQSHTNVVKLFKAHKAADRAGTLKATGHYRIYVPGLGTRFPENREWRESADGKALGKGGQARILFGLLQVYNAIHQAFSDGARMFEDNDIPAKIQQYAQDVETNDPLRDAHEPRPDRRTWFDALNKELNDKLGKARAARRWPDIPKITLNVFGFSRGAVEARAFCYWFSDMLKDGKLAGMPAEITFLGLFDSVASIGLANSAAESTPLFFANGHFSWAAETLKPLPQCVKKTVHYIAAHEQRRNFPVTRVTGNNVSEYIYPGVHSDVGGGYGPGDQGRGMKTGLMLSQIPLLHMHHAATVAGVPLAAYCVMPSDLRADYEIDPVISRAWNTYMDYGKEQFQSNDYDKIVREHMRLLYLFRSRWLHDFTHIPPYTRAKNPQEKEDIRSYNDLLKGDLAILRKRIYFAQQGGRHYDLPLEHEEIANSNQWQQQLYRNKVAPRTDELWAFKQFERPPASFDEPYMLLLRDQVHDSLAGFSMVGYSADEEKAERILDMVRQYSKSGRGPTSPYDRQVWNNYQNAIKDAPGMAAMMQEKLDICQEAENAPGHRAEQFKAMENAEQQTQFDPVQQQKLAQLFPLQTDANVADLRSKFISPQTNKRREGSGYLRRRIVF